MEPQPNPVSRFLLSRIAVAVLPCAALFLAAGCDRPGSEAYTIPKEHPPIRTNPPARATAATAPAPARIQWTTPEGWQELPATGMRAAAFSIPGPDNAKADLVVIPLPGTSGIEQESLNMWRSEIGLPPAASDDFASTGESVPVGGVQGNLYDLASGTAASEAEKGTLGVIASHEGTTWFMKLTGPRELVAGQKETFKQFLAGLKFTNGQAPAATAQAAAPASPTGAPPQAGAWNPPPHWEAKPAGGMRLASYAVTGSNGQKGDLSVISLDGAAGGLLANVNRWRDQVGLPAISEAELGRTSTSLDLGHTQATLVDMVSADGKTRVLGAVVPQAQKTLFYKLTGDADLVGQEVEAFRKLVETAEYSHAR